MRRELQAALCATDAGGTLSVCAAASHCPCCHIAAPAAAATGWLIK
jgi:hypothetical protein